MQTKLRIFFGSIAIALLLIFTDPAEAKQGGVLLPEPVNARMETWRTHREVYKKFTYELDHPTDLRVDTWNVYDGNFPFVGDCEDFAFTMQRMIGAGSVYFAYLPDGTEVEGQKILPNHAVFIYAGMVWELNGMAINIQRYESQGLYIFFRYGDITPELK